MNTFAFHQQLHKQMQSNAVAEQRLQKGIPILNNLLIIQNT